MDKLTRNYLAISKRDADCYDVTDGQERVAALRADFTTDDKGNRTATPGTWRIRWEDSEGRAARAARFAMIKIPDRLEELRFQSVQEAFAFYVGQVLS